MQPSVRHLVIAGYAALSRRAFRPCALGSPLLAPASLALAAAASFCFAETAAVAVAVPDALAPAAPVAAAPPLTLLVPEAPQVAEQRPRPVRMRALVLPRPAALDVSLAFTPRDRPDGESADLIPELPSSGPLRLRPGTGPAQAFAQELRKESQRYLDRGLWANAALEIDEDDYILESRANAAERVLARAAEAGLGVMLESMARSTGEPGGGKSVAQRGNFSFRLDTNPGWTWRKKSAFSSMRVDIPLTGQGIRFRTSREFASHDKGLKHMTSGVSVDPWDQSIRFGFTLGF